MSLIFQCAVQNVSIFYSLTLGWGELALRIVSKAFDVLCWRSRLRLGEVRDGRWGVALCVRIFKINGLPWLLGRPFYIVGLCLLSGYLAGVLLYAGLTSYFPDKNLLKVVHLAHPFL